MEATLQQLTQRLQEAAQRILGLESGLAAQQQQQQQPPSPHGGGVRSLGIKARSLGRPDTLDGVVPLHFRGWSVVVRSFVSVASPAIRDILGSAETECEAPRNDQMGRQSCAASQDLHHTLLSLSRGAAKDKVTNAGDGEGARAWGALMDRWEPRVCTR